MLNAENLRKVQNTQRIKYVQFVVQGMFIFKYASPNNNKLWFPVVLCEISFRNSRVILLNEDA